MIDTHCHLDMLSLEEDILESVGRLDYLLTIGCDNQEIYKAIEFTKKFDNIYASIGYHPYDIGDISEKDIENLAKLYKNNSKVVAIGECGLDFYRDKTPKNLQEKFFRLQIELAKELKLPIIIHSREADADIERILSEYAPFENGGIMHCFGGSLRLMEATLEMGFYISFAGNITYPKADNLREIAKKVPLDRLLLETDSPFLAPQKVRGKPNKPSNIFYTLEFVANLLGISSLELEKITDENAKRLLKFDN
jgi:TatD DNase family protein